MLERPREDGTRTVVLRGIGAGCDEEALRVIKLARFEPGRQRGKPVKVRYVIPVRLFIGMYDGRFCSASRTGSEACAAMLSSIKRPFEALFVDSKGWQTVSVACKNRLSISIIHSDKQPPVRFKLRGVARTN